MAKTSKRKLDPNRHTGLGLFSAHEANQFDNLVALIKQYLARPAPSRPLCLAVFGAPGSGKSRAVRALPAHLGKVGSSLAGLTEINLTQMTSVDNLAASLRGAKKEAEESKKVPFVFFDEVDS